MACLSGYIGCLQGSARIHVFVLGYVGLGDEVEGP